MASAQNTTLRSPTAIVHLDYAPESISPPPSGDWTRFVCISDTHSHTFDVPPGDVLLHSGDLTGTGTLKGFQKTMEWLYELPHKTKMSAPGLCRECAPNSELYVESSRETMIFPSTKGGMTVTITAGMA